jgi:hypothetical protein
MPLGDSLKLLIDSKIFSLPKFGMDFGPIDELSEKIDALSVSTFYSSFCICPSFSNYNDEKLF